MRRPPCAFGHVILARLRLMKMSRKDVLELMRQQGHAVDRRTLSAWIVGRRQPDYSNLVALADALAIPHEERGALIDLLSRAA